VSALLDVNGREIVEPARLTVCSGCGGTKLDRSEGFGGFWQVVCRECGRTLAQGRKS
jgi:ribosomal protein L37AE/L43A